MKRSLALAAAIALALAGWMASGWLDREPERTAARAGDGGPAPTRVQVRTVTAQPLTRRVTLQGQTEANRTVALKAATTGRAVELPHEKGTVLAGGDLVARQAMNDRRARLDEADARVAQRKSEYEAAQDLEKKGFQARNRLKEARAQLAAARAQRERIREEISDTRITAPFTGILAERGVEMGDYLSPGTTVARLMDVTPMLVVGDVPQQRVGALETGRRAQVRLTTGRTATGVVSFIAPAAETTTRTYRVEVEIPNPDRDIPGGMSARVRIPTETVSAHKVSPAVFSLAADGTLGIKTATGDGTAAFHPVEIVRAAPEGAWVAGLPETARVITLGQGFVRAGDAIDPVPAGSEAAVTRPGATPAPPLAPGLGSTGG